MSAVSAGRRDVLVGRIFNNRFRIQSLIARGGMGKVYRAVQVPLGRVVALKVLNPSYTAEQSADFHRRFHLEASIAAQLSHPNTVTVFDFGKSDDEIYYLAMEYLQGLSLRTTLLRARSFAPRRAVNIAMQMAHALREAHSLGAVHRDLKPANVFLLQGGEEPDFVKVLDFGLVKHVTVDDHEGGITQPGKFLGSPGYMAPEQIRGRPVDGRCDIYALGVLLYEMLTGCPPFVRTNAIETMMAHVHDAVPRMQSVQPSLRVPPRLEELVHTCLAKDPAARYPTIHALLADLKELSGRPAEPLSSATEPRIMRRTPVRLEDEEQSGWSMVSATGILALPRARPTPVPAEAAPTVLNQTMAMAVPRDAPPPPAVPRRRRIALAALLCIALPQLQAMGRVAYAAWQKRQTRQATATVHLVSAPPGAAVYIGDTLICAHTPCALNWLGDEARAGRPMSFRFVLPGFDEFVASRVMSGTCLEVKSTLYPSRERAP